MNAYFEIKWKNADDPFDTSKKHLASSPASIIKEGVTATQVLGQLSLYHHFIQSSQQRSHIFAVFIIKDQYRILVHTRSGTLVTDRFPVIVKRGNSYCSSKLHDFLWRLTHTHGVNACYDDTFIPLTRDLSQPAASVRRQLQLDATEPLFQVAVDQVGDKPDEKPIRKWYIVSKPFTHTHHTNFGRTTRVFDAYDCESGALVLLKDQWRIQGYDPEGITYQRLQNSGVELRVQMLWHGDVAGQCCGDEAPADEIIGSPRQVLIHYRMILDGRGRPFEKFSSTYDAVTVIREVVERKRSIVIQHRAHSF